MFLLTINTILYNNIALIVLLIFQLSSDYSFNLLVQNKIFFLKCTEFCLFCSKKIKFFYLFNKNNSMSYNYNKLF